MSAIPMYSLDEMPDPGWDPEAVDPGSNALGLEPVRVLFLWPFARPMNLRAQVIGHGWAQIGPVHLLLRPGWGLMKWVLQSLDQVHDALGELSDLPGRQKAPQLRFGDGIWRPYYGYPVQPLTVDGSIWQEVLNVLTDRCGLFVADMTAKRHPQGLAHELLYLFNYVHPSRIVLLIDTAQADVGLCAGLAEDSWQQSSGGGDSPPPILLYDSQSRAYVGKAFRGAFGGGATIPIAPKALGALGW